MCITFASKALLILARLCILDSPLSICPIIRSMSWNSLHLSQNTALYSLTSSAVLPKFKIFNAKKRLQFFIIFLFTIFNYVILVCTFYFF